jgi:putative acyl-CoA dehydrogenase
MSKFIQPSPEITNTFLSDPLLNNYLNTVLPKSVYDQVKNHLEIVGAKAAGEWLDDSNEAEKNQPKLKSFTPWGERVDEIEVSQAWKNLEKAAATEGVVAAAYENKYGEFSRVYQMTLLYLFSPSSAFVSCPLAMTDGAARVLKKIQNQHPEFKKAYENLTSRRPEQFWTSGQWMTEKTGGSDVGLTETVAHKKSDHYELSGDKWFTSATTSQMALTLARTSSEPGARGLSLFYVQVRSDQLGSLGRLNNITVHRLKEKLGTKALPTAELSLNKTKAILIGNEGEGVKKISELLNITRIYNSICALGHMRRALDLAQDYAKKRKAFGKTIGEHPLHKKTLSDLEDQFRNCFYFTFYVVGLLGREENNLLSASESVLLRALTPLVKLYTGKKVMHICSEVIESIGGMAYIEDTGLPRLLRDAQVFSIWEGTTNVLSLDFLRACEKERAMRSVEDFFESKTQSNFIKNNRERPWGDIALARENCFSLCDDIIESLRPS